MGIAFRLLVGFCLLFALKFHYSVADANSLRWILAPTAWMVEQLTGHRFVFESGVGYTARSVHFVIAPVCAGINFMIAALLLVLVVRLRAASTRLLWGGLLAVALTVQVNAFRIAVALQGDHGAAAHRMLGIVVFLLGLFVLWFLLEGEAKKWWMPLLCYGTVALVIPLLNGAAKRPDFLSHSMWVGGTCLLVAFAITVLRGRFGRHEELC